MTLKVLHVIPSLSPLRGGPSFSVPAMVRGLARAGLTVHIATTDDHGAGHLEVPLEKPVAQQGVTHWYFRRQTGFYTISWPLIRWLAQHVREYDVVHTHYLFTFSSLAVALIASLQGVPYIVRPVGALNRWGIYKRRPAMKKLSLHFAERHILTNAACVQFTSEQERLQAEELAIPFSSIIIPLGLDLALFQQIPPEGTFRQQYPELSNKRVILFLSRFHPIKGLDLLLPAFAQVRQTHPDVALVLAGSGTPDFEAQLRAQVAARGLQQDVIFTGFLHDEEKRAAFRDCDVFVQPSYFENFSMSVVEAMASNLPVVVTDQVGVGHEVSRAQAGLVVPCQSNTLAHALLHLISDSDQRQRFVNNARALVQERFAIEVIVRSLITLYDDVLAAPSA